MGYKDVGIRKSDLIPFIVWLAYSLSSKKTSIKQRCKIKPIKVAAFKKKHLIFLSKSAAS